MSTAPTGIQVRIVNAYAGSLSPGARRALEEAGYTVNLDAAGWAAETDTVLVFDGTDDDYERQAYDAAGVASIVEAAGQRVDVKHSYYEVVDLTGARETLTFG